MAELLVLELAELAGKSASDQLKPDRLKCALIGALNRYDIRATLRISPGRPSWRHSHATRLPASFVDYPLKLMVEQKKRWLVLFGVWQIYICFGLMIASLAPLVSAIRADLGIGNSKIGAILGAWPLVYILAAIPCGAVVDRFGARPALALAAFVIAASGVARSIAETPTELWLAVALFGVGGPLISVGAPKIISGLFDGKSRATAMGIYITGPYLGGMLSLLLANSVFMPMFDGNWRAVVSLYAAIAGLTGLIWIGIAVE